MKTLKSLIALTAIVTLSFGCASVTDASLSDELADQDNTEITTTNDGVFNTTGGVSVEPIVEKPW